MSNTFTKGSKWRKWDLHVHSPFSYENHFSDWVTYIDKLKEKAVFHDIDVAGINDYFSVDGYEKLLDKCEEETKKSNPCIKLDNDKMLYLFPVVELRLENFTSNNESVNIHVVFSPDLLPSTIRSSFLEKLTIKYQSLDLNCKADDLIKIGYSEENSGRFDTNLDLSSFPEQFKKRLIQKALKVISFSSSIFEDGIEKFKKILKKSGIEDDKYLIIIANKGRGGLGTFHWHDKFKDLSRAGNIRQNLLNLSDACFSNDINDIHFLLGQKNEIEEKRKTSKKLSIEKEELEHLRNDLSQFAETIKNYVTDNKESYAKYGLSISEIIKFEIDFKAIETKIEEKEDQIRKVNNYLLTQDEIDNVLEKQQLTKESQIIIKQDIETMIERIKNELSEQEKCYQKYVEDFKRWDDIKNEIEGDEQSINTIKWFKKEIGFISSELENQLSILRKQRVEKSLEIYRLKNEIVDIYKRFKESIDNEIKKHQNILGEYEINIEAALKINQDFCDNFLGYINKNRRGSFYGIDEGKDIMKKLIENADFNIDHDVENVLNEIIKLLEFDQREQFKNERRYITDQISENELNEFYTYVFSFEYLEPTYELRLSDKKISQLSSGEKGALLIVFYLILEKDNIPLIIDQPEENLDNESIFKILTHFIKETKKKRQLIMVTHNPNLAIVGDTEQIIFVEIDKKNGNKFSFESGAIENPKINKHASDILEGTLKAFDIRRLKYLKPNFANQK